MQSGSDEHAIERVAMVQRQLKHSQRVTRLERNEGESQILRGLQQVRFGYRQLVDGRLYRDFRYGHGAQQQFVFLILGECSRSTAESVEALLGERNEDVRVQKEPHSGFAPHPGFDIFLRLRPVRIEDQDLAAQSSKSPRCAVARPCGNQIGNGNPVPANGYAVAALHLLDELGQLVLSLGDADLHVVNYS
jgi:hypothetical protein